MLNALSAVKFLVSGAVGIGAGKIARDIIKNNISEPNSLIDKAAMLGASWAIGGMAATASKDYTNEQIDYVVKSVRDAMAELKLKAALTRINKAESTFEEEGLESSHFRLKEDGTWEKYPSSDETK